MDPNTNVSVPVEVVEKLRAVRQLIPEYTQLTVAGAKVLRTAAAADPAFVDERRDASERRLHRDVVHRHTEHHC